MGFQVSGGNNNLFLKNNEHILLRHNKERHRKVNIGC